MSRKFLEEEQRIKFRRDLLNLGQEKILIDALKTCKHKERHMSLQIKLPEEIKTSMQTLGWKL